MGKSDKPVRIGLVLVLVALFVLGFILLVPTSGARLRGNKLALFLCQIELTNLKNASTNSDSFDFSNISYDNQRQVLKSGFPVKLWFKTNVVWANTSRRDVIIVCEREYDNVPKPSIWNFYHKNPAHAVGYSDGTIGLITPGEFQALDLTGFVSAVNVATNSEFKIVE